MSNPVSRKRKELVIEHRAKKRLGWYMGVLVGGCYSTGMLHFTSHGYGTEVTYLVTGPKTPAIA